MSATSTENASSLLTPVTRTDRKRKEMPYAPAFERALHGIASGKFDPKKESLKKISPDKAKRMLAEAHGRHKGQVRAIRKIAGEE